MRFRALLALLVLASLEGILGVARGLRAAPTEIVPTTTRETGDRGGLYFGQVPDPRKVRRAYIAAESTAWDYAPTGRDAVCGLPFPAALSANHETGKTRYIQYIDATFTTRAMANPTLGLLGPILRGVVGEFLVVTFLNRTDQPLSLHPHGVRYDKDSEGSYYQPSPGRGAAVAPGATYTYVWALDAASGPLPTEPSSRAWLYHSHVAGDQETNLGLVGAIIVTDPARARADGTPADVDREFATLFMIFDESGLDDAAVEAAEYAQLPGAAAPPLTWHELQQALADGARPSLNGRMFGHLSGLAANAGERVRWYLLGLGSQNDFHSPTWSGLRVVEGGRRTGAVELLPASMKAADLVADTPGDWLFRCAVAEHTRAGMFARFTVHAPGTVGIDRTPAHAFLGHAKALHSAHLTRAEFDAQGNLLLAGSATVYEGYAIFNQPIAFTLGAATATFHPDAAGNATSPTGKLRITNATEFGVINAGVLEFEAVLRGPDWEREANLRRPPSGARARAPASAGEAAFTLECGRARHRLSATLSFHP